MIRVRIYLVIVALLAFGAVWLAERPGDVVITWQGERVETSVMVLMAAAAAVAVAAVALWSIARAIVRSPDAVSRFLRNRRGVRAYQAVSHGLIAVGSGDARAAKKFTAEARRIAPSEPLTLLLSAQAAQLAGDRDAAAATFQQMAGRDDTKVLGLHGLFVEAQRRNDPAAALFYAEEAAKQAAVPPWAGQAVLEFRCVAGDWSGALTRLERNMKSGLIDKTAYRRQRAVLLTAQALAAEDGVAPPTAGQPDGFMPTSGKPDVGRERAQALALEAVKLAPDLVPAAALAGRLLGAAGEKRKATRIIEAAWRANPHPDLADAFAHLQPGDSARERLARVESLAGKATGDAEAAIAVARAALDAKEFSVARAALVPLLEMPTRRVAALMAALELQEGDEGRGREWMARTLNARRDPAWTADGHVSDHWLPVSPVTGRLDAFEWRDPLAGVDHTGATIDAEHRALRCTARGAAAARRADAGAEHTGAVVPARRPTACAGRGQIRRVVCTTSGQPTPASLPDIGGGADVFPTSGKPDVGGGDEPTRTVEPASPHDEPRPPPVIALAHVPDDPGPESGTPPEEPAVEPGSVAPPDGWSRFRARFR
jgi:HemY protein